MNPRLFIRKGLTLTQLQLRKIGQIIYSSEYERSRDMWYRDNGDLTFRLNYDDLDETSIVFDLGGWQGGWASDIYSKYNCNVYVFEPVQAYAEFIQNRFKKNAKIQVFDFGLGPKSERLKIHIGSEGSSLFKNVNNKNKREVIFIKSISDFLFENEVGEISLLKLNIEGGEYDLLDAIIGTGLIERVRHLQIQFHDFVDNATSRRDVIRNQMRKTHRMTFDYPFVWEGWTRP